MQWYREKVREVVVVVARGKGAGNRAMRCRLGEFGEGWGVGMSYDVRSFVYVFLRVRARGRAVKWR
jgi:hypothetical protein